MKISNSIHNSSNVKHNVLLSGNPRKYIIYIFLVIKRNRGQKVRNEIALETTQQHICKQIKSLTVPIFKRDNIQT